MKMYLFRHEGFVFLQTSNYSNIARQQFRGLLEAKITEYLQENNSQQATHLLNLVVLFRAIVHFAEFFDQADFWGKLAKALPFSIDFIPARIFVPRVVDLIAAARDEYILRFPNALTLEKSPSILAELVDRVWYIRNQGIDPFNHKFQFRRRSLPYHGPDNEWDIKKTELLDILRLPNSDRIFLSREFQNIGLSRHKLAISSQSDTPATDSETDSDQEDQPPEATPSEIQEPTSEKEDEKVPLQGRRLLVSVSSEVIKTPSPNPDLSYGQRTPQLSTNTRTAPAKVLDIDPNQEVDGFYFKHSKSYGHAFTDSINTPVPGYNPDDLAATRLMNLLAIFRCIIHLSPFSRSKDFWVQLKSHIFPFYPDPGSKSLVPRDMAIISLWARKRFLSLHPGSPTLAKAPNLLAELVDRVGEIFDGRGDLRNPEAQNSCNLDALPDVYSSLYKEKSREFVQMMQRDNFYIVFQDRSLVVLELTDFSPATKMPRPSRKGNGGKRRPHSSPTSRAPKRRKHNIDPVVIDLTKGDSPRVAIPDAVKDEDYFDKESIKSTPESGKDFNALSPIQSRPKKPSRLIGRVKELGTRLDLVEQAGKDRAQTLRESIGDVKETLKDATRRRQREHKTEMGQMTGRVKEVENQIYGVKNIHEVDLKALEERIKITQSNKRKGMRKAINLRLVAKSETLESKINKQEEAYKDWVEKVESKQEDEKVLLRSEIQECRRDIQDLKALIPSLASKDVLLVNQHTEIQNLRRENHALRGGVQVPVPARQWHVPSSPRALTRALPASRWRGEENRYRYSNDKSNDNSNGKS